MNTPLKHRLAAAFASMSMTLTLLSAVVANAEQPVLGVMLTQADSARVQ